MGVSKLSDSNVSYALGFLLKTSLYPRIWRRQQDPGDLESKGSGLRGLKANPVWILASVAQAFAGWAGQGQPDSLKFDPAGWKPSFLSLGKHALDPATIYHLIPGFSLSFYNWKVGTRHQGGVSLILPLKVWISKALL